MADSSGGRGAGALQWLRDSAQGLEKRYGDKRVLRGVGSEVARDGFLLVTGPNGSGKTTLLRLLRGARGCLPPGSCTFARTRPHRLHRARAARLPRAAPHSRTSTSTVASTASPSGVSAPGCCSSASGSGRRGTSAPTRTRAGCCSGWRSAVRCCTIRTCSSSTSRTAASTRRVPRCSTASSRKRAAALTVRRRDTRPGAASNRLASARLALA